MAAARDTTSGLHPLGRMKYYHDAVSLILCEPLSAERLALFEALLDEAAALQVEPPAPEWRDWVIHYQVVMEALTGAELDAPAAGGGRRWPSSLLDRRWPHARR